ncbi:hypothetical protein ACXN5S_03345 [Pseudoroseicyclus sp. H15]
MNAASGIATALLLAGLAAPVQADIFERLAASSWGHEFDSDASCLNPHRFSFPADRSRLVITWEEPITDYEYNQCLSGGYDVVSVEEERLTLALDGESRLGPDGQPVTWVLELLPTGVYCWHTTDETKLQCDGWAMACPAPLPLS